MTPAILFDPMVSRMPSRETVPSLGCLTDDLGRPGDPKTPDLSRINRRSVRPDIGHATISHVACVVILATPAGAPIPDAAWMDQEQFETGSTSGMRLLAAAAHDLGDRVRDAVAASRRDGGMLPLGSALGSTAAIERARRVWLDHSPHDAVGICPPTPWSPAAWIGEGITRRSGMNPDVAAMLAPVVEVRLTETGTRFTTKLSALAIILGPMDPVARLRAMAEAETDDA